MRESGQEDRRGGNARRGPPTIDPTMRAVVNTGPGGNCAHRHGVEPREGA